MKKGIAKHTAFCLAMGFALTQGGAMASAATPGPDLPLVGLSSTSRRVSAGEMQTEGTIAQDNEGAVLSGEETFEAVGVGTVGVPKKAAADLQEITPVEVSDEYIASQPANGYGDTTGLTLVPTPGEENSTEAAGTDMDGAAGAASQDADADRETAIKAANDAADGTIDEVADGADGADGADEAAVETSNDGADAADDAAAADDANAGSVESGAEGMDTSMVGSTGFAQCSEYLNVRSDASADADPVGKVYNNGSLEILGVTPDGWYQVRSGNVEGYVNADYVAIGEQAESIASDTGYTTAQTAVDGLNVRTDASTDADIMATIDDSHSMEVVEDQGDWVKVLIDGEMYGYVSADYVSTTTEYATGETLEEEEERLNQEWLAYLAEQEAAQAAAEAAYLAAIAEQQAQSYYETTSYYDGGSYTDTSYSAPAVSTSGSADELASQAASLYESYVAAQNAADAAVANGEGEQAINDTATAAINAYQTYLAAQNAADAAAAGMYVDTSAVAYTDGTSAEAYTAAQTYDGGSYSDDSGSYDDGSGSSSGSSGYSSAGQAIADYATQFVGNPYVYGGSSLTGGADCSGFTMAVMANFGIGLPHNAEAQSGCGTAVSLDELQPGDLLFYSGDGGIGHVTMYIGNGQVVHASNPSSGIKISDIGYRTPVSARRFV